MWFKKRITRVCVWYPAVNPHNLIENPPFVVHFLGNQCFSHVYVGLPQGKYNEQTYEPNQQKERLVSGWPSNDCPRGSDGQLTVCDIENDP